MKKLIPILIISMTMLITLTTSPPAKAQSALVYAFNSSVTKHDTITDTGKDTLTIDFSTNYYWQAIWIQPTLTKVSGTAAGSAILYERVYGTYVPTGDTLTFTNQTTNTTIWKKSNVAATGYMIVMAGSGTMVATTSAKLAPRRP